MDDDMTNSENRYCRPISQTAPSEIEPTREAMALFVAGRASGIVIDMGDEIDLSDRQMQAIEQAVMEWRKAVPSEVEATATEGELLPCPFCGGEGEARHWPHGWRTHCIDCRVWTPHRSSKSQTIEDWNRRATPTATEDGYCEFAGWCKLRGKFHENRGTSPTPTATEDAIPKPLDTDAESCYPHDGVSA